MESLAYSDIHHDDYKNGITLEDTISIEDEITQYAVDHDITDVFFMGDWFRATNPLQLVIKEAEASWVRRSRAGVTTTVLVGNHDRFTKSENSKHAFYTMPIFRLDLACVRIYDKISLISYPDVDLLLFPAGWQNKLTSSEIRRSSNRPLIVMLHAMINGSTLASGINSQGMDPQIIKNYNPDLVLAGDNHTPQRLSMFDCEAYYLGAPLQHTWGDKGQERGFYHIKIDGKKIEYNKIVTRSPKFVRANIFAENEVSFICDITNLLHKELNDCPGIVDLTLTGNNVGIINKQIIEDSIKQNFNIRKLKIGINHQIVRPEVVAGISKISLPEDKWSAYITSGNATNIKDMNTQMLLEMGKWALQEARKL